MRHGNYKYKLNVSPEHRKSMIKNLSISLIEHGKIRTTISRCKALKSHVEKLITIAKEDTVANRRLVFSRLNNKNAVKKLFSDVAPKFKERPGGYTRIYRVADIRVGDGAKMAFVSLVD